MCSTRGASCLARSASFRSSAPSPQQAGLPRLPGHRPDLARVEGLRGEIRLYDKPEPPLAAGLFGSTLRPFIGLLFVFVFRQLCQAICTLPIPPRMIWRNPGFPSLLVTYGVANDFFISGHTAIAVLGAIEIARLFPWPYAIAAALVAFGEALMVIVLRAHYTMDVLAAIAASFCAATLALRLCTAFAI